MIIETGCHYGSFIRVEEIGDRYALDMWTRDKKTAVLSHATKDALRLLRDYLNALELGDSAPKKPAAPLFWLGRDAEAA